MKTRSLYLLLATLIVAFASSCKEEANNWEYDGSQDALFRSLTFEVQSVKGTSLEMKYTHVIDASKYIFEFSEGDSLEFTNITRIDTILADTLTPYLKETAPMKTEYRTLFENLNGTTRYSVRMKAIDEINGKEAGYVQAFFVTPIEQIITNTVASIDKITVEWDAKKKVTHLFFGEVVEGQEMVYGERQLLTEEQQKAGSATIEGLLSGTTYHILIYNDKAARGSTRVRTLGLNKGETIPVLPGDVVNEILAERAAAGVTELALVFKSGQVYELESVTLPEGIENLYFVGDVEAGEQLPELYLHTVQLSTTISNLSFQFIDMDARSNSSNFVFNVGNENCFDGIGFEGCTIRNIARSLIRLNYDKLTISSIKINNCLIQHVGKGGYGLINIGKAMESIGSISITNSTMMEMGDQLMQTNAGIESIEINKCIFCNYTTGIPKIFRFDKQPGAVSVKNTFFVGTNNGTAVNSGNGDYSSYLDFYTCYLTSDFVVNKNKFTNAEIMKLTSEELFTDPRNGDFHLKEGVKFAGEGIVGDPRWW